LIYIVVILLTITQLLQQLLMTMRAWLFVDVGIGKSKYLV